MIYTEVHACMLVWYPRLLQSSRVDTKATQMQMAQIMSIIIHTWRDKP